MRVAPAAATAAREYLADQIFAVQGWVQAHWCDRHDEPEEPDEPATFPRFDECGQPER